VSEENVAIIKAIFEADATTSKDEILQALPNLIPAPFHPDAEWAEAPDHVDAKTYRGHDGILESFEQRLDQSEDCKIEALRFEDQAEVFVVGRESGRGHGAAHRPTPLFIPWSRFVTARSASTASSTTRRLPEPHLNGTTRSGPIARRGQTAYSSLR
jgi:ketosteroid isomerase-like protein